MVSLDSAPKIVKFSAIFPLNSHNQLCRQLRWQPIAGFGPTFLMVVPNIASWSSRPCNNGRCAFSYIRPNASTQGPPTSSAVQVNQGHPGVITAGSLPTELEARLHPALATSCRVAMAGASVSPHERRPNLNFELRAGIWLHLPP